MGTLFFEINPKTKGLGMGYGNPNVGTRRRSGFSEPKERTVNIQFHSTKCLCVARC